MNKVSFSTIFNFQKKSKIKAGDGLGFNEGKYPFFTSSDTLTKSINEYLFDCESLIFGTGGKASIHFYENKFAVSTDCFVCQPKDTTKVFTKFVFYYLYGNIHFLEEGFKGAGLKHISKAYISNLKIPLPPLETQKKIAAILDEADKLRQLDKQLIEKYDALTQSLFLDMFGDPVTNPKGWDKLPLKSFGKIVTGNTPSRNNKANYDSKYIEWVKTGNILPNKIHLTEAEEYLSEEGLKNGRSVREGSLLVCCIAGSIKSIGRAGITNKEVAFNQQINAIEPSEEISPYFLYYLFKCSVEYIQNHATIGMKRMLSKGDFQKILMIKPPYGLQNQFAERVEAIEAQKALAQQSIEKSEELFNSLLQKAFKGELV